MLTCSAVSVQTYARDHADPLPLLMQTLSLCSCRPYACDPTEADTHSEVNI